MFTDHLSQHQKNIQIYTQTLTHCLSANTCAPFKFMQKQEEYKATTTENIKYQALLVPVHWTKELKIDTQRIHKIELKQQHRIQRWNADELTTSIPSDTLQPQIDWM